MHNKKVFIVIVFIIAITMAFGFQNSSEHKVLFEKAKYTMETKGDLNGAIQLFEEIIQKYPNERAYAAKSQLYIGICFEKLGQKEAQKAYQRVIKDFADQSEVVAEARTRLASLEKPGGQIRPVLAEGEREGLTFRKIEFPDQDHVTHLARLSPDGSKMLYVRYQAKKPRFSLYVLDLSSGQEKLLIEGVEAGGNNYFEWSPDGKRIVYKHGRGGIGVIGTDGRDPKVLWSPSDPKVDATPVDWSLDGKDILCYVLNSANWNLQLAILSSSGGEPRFFLERDLKSFIGGAAQFSPDGKYVVGQMTKEGNTDLYILAVDTGQEIRLTEHSSKDDYPFWSPDGKYIVFTSDRAKTVDLWAISMKETEPMGDPVLIKRNLGKNVRLSKYTPGGVLTMLVFSQGGGKNLFLLPVDTITGEAQGSLSPFAKYPTDHSLHRWSPDGKRVAYTSRKGNIGIPKIYISSGSQKDEVEIPSQNYFVGNIEWSRNGEFLVFPGFPNQDPEARAGIFRISLKNFRIEPLLLGDNLKPGLLGAFINLRWLPKANTFMFEKLLDISTGNSYRREIYTMDGNGKNVQLVTDKISAGPWTWPSPNGKYLASQEGQDLKLWSLERDVFIVTLVHVSEGKPWEHPAWSPEGRHVAFKDKKQLKVFSIPENTSRVLVEAGENSEIGVPWYRGLAWSPDGQTIAYILRDTSADSKVQSELWIVSASGGTPRKIADAPASYPVLGGLTWHPDGKRLVVSGEAAEAQSRLYEHWLMENFLPGAKAQKKSNKQ